MDNDAPLRRPSIEHNMGLLDPHGSDSNSDNSFNAGPHYLTDRTRSFIDYSKSTSWRSLIGRLIHFLIPSFLQGRRTHEQSRPPKIGPTAYLDGVRGLAALTVFISHHFSQAYSDEAWGCGGKFYGIMRLPILRLLHTERPSVSQIRRPPASIQLWIGTVDELGRGLI
ncbi:hypothetical protein B0J13DRAFT_45581 [Dactylonectria estremocensis]|uniref:Acyltransferase 3 domain-containing protein n=1 Tax=Dactylonectria estremocensis TaxID=1079267 RepID=A0A9P9J7D2_9HYPO|nr:hypothetical protein B0J13DRAFT_45581 [Dactylonectria estremocensis]